MRRSGFKWLAIGSALIAYNIWHMSRSGEFYTKFFALGGTLALGGLWASLIKLPPDQTEFGKGGWWQHGIILSGIAGAVLGVIATYRLTGSWF